MIAAFHLPVAACIYSQCLFSWLIEILNNKLTQPFIYYNAPVNEQSRSKLRGILSIKIIPVTASGIDKETEFPDAVYGHFNQQHLCVYYKR